MPLMSIDPFLEDFERQFDRLARQAAASSKVAQIMTTVVDTAAMVPWAATGAEARL